MFLALSFELSDINQDYSDILFQFLRCSIQLTEQQLYQILKQTELSSYEFRNVVDLLLWFGFLGVQTSSHEEPQFAYEIRYNVPKLVAPIKAGFGSYVIHPAFRSALQCAE